MARKDDIFNYKSKTSINGVLINNLGIEDPILLEEVERLVTTFKLSKLYLNPKEQGKQTFDVNHYLNIHKYLFCDIYPFAGTIRDEVIEKVIPFCLPNYIYYNLKNTLDMAKKQSRLVTSREDLVKFITNLYAELDIIHPFREGNGRCEREFIRQYVIEITKQNNLEEYIIDYSKIDNKDEFIKAVIIADATCDTKYLESFINKLIVSPKSYKKIK